jgi:hypothetical protein
MLDMELLAIEVNFNWNGMARHDATRGQGARVVNSTKQG